MERNPVSSTSLRSVGYDPENRLLEVEFTSGRVYRYRNVPPDEYKDLMNAESHGQFFNARIRDVYSYEELGR